LKNLDTLEGEGIKTKEDMSCMLATKSMDLLLKMEDSLNQTELFQLSECCYSLWSAFPAKRLPELAIAIVSSHSKSIQLGYLKAMKLFPKMLTLIEEMSGNDLVLESFTTKMSKVNKLENLPPGPGTLHNKFHATFPRKNNILIC
jgi:hypothetical protein